MPIYPAMALLIGGAFAVESSWWKWGTRIVAAVFGLLSVVLFGLLVAVKNKPAPGDISSALTQNPELYTLSLGHMTDLTMGAFAYLKLPLAVAAVAFAIATAGVLLFRRKKMGVALALTVAMIIFFQASRLALVRFQNYLGSYPLAQALQQAPPGDLIEGDAYYAFSSVFFYTNRTALLWDGRVNNLEYGSYAPDAPQIFLDDTQLSLKWSEQKRYYLLTYGSEMPKLGLLLGKENIYVVKENAGNYLLTNFPL